MRVMSAVVEIRGPRLTAWSDALRFDELALSDEASADEALSTVSETVLEFLGNAYPPMAPTTNAAAGTIQEFFMIFE